jgi:amidohydrolase
MDALIVPSHACANPENGAAHCCGHDAQLTGVVGAAVALSDEEVRNELSGGIVFAGLPAEECVELEYRSSLIDEGVIRYQGGKCEWLRLGAFDDVDLCVVHHTHSGSIPLTYGTGTWSGFVSKMVTYHGKSAHAASAPDRGINALYCANVAMTAINALRETFRDRDAVRVHSIIKQGGDLVNIIPDNIVMECMVRAKTMEAVLETEKKIDRAFRAGAIAMGADVTIRTLPGYLPMVPLEDGFLDELGGIAAPGLPSRRVPPDTHTGGSTDVGDLSHLMPIVQFGTGGVSGILHSPSFTVTDEDTYYILTAKMFALAAYRLLRNGAALKDSLVGAYKPKLTKKSYLTYMEDTRRVEKVSG